VRNIRLLALSLAVVMSGIPMAFASTHVHQLGIAPLLGVTSSTPALRRAFAEHPETIREAARKIGLSPAEYHAFITKFNRQKPYWGEVPRHLDAMSWAADGHVYALHDVDIPSGVNGWEVDLRERHQLVAIYIPMICGNLSVVRRPIREVAMRPPLPPVPYHPVAAPPPPPPLVAAQPPVPIAQQIPPPAPPPPVIHHPHLLLPILAGVAVIALLTTHHHGSSSTTPTTPSTPGGSVGGTGYVPPGAGGGSVGSPMIPPPHGCSCGSSY